MRLAVAVFLVACADPMLPGAEHPPRPSHASVLDLLAEEWRAAGLPWRSQCDAERQRLVVALVDDRTMRRALGFCAAESPTCVETRSAGTPFEIDTARAIAGCAYGICSAGGMLVERADMWPVGLATTQRVTLVISAYFDERERVRGVIHEGLHWLSRCSSGWRDEQHRDRRVWRLRGLETVEARALARVE
jgi:hypothetical protein